MGSGAQSSLNRILLIEDDAELRAALAERLQEAGYKVIEAADGAAGLAAQRSQPADLVITDLFMPGQEGIETLFSFRREHPALKIIAMSAGMAEHGRYDYLSVAAAIGADICLRKPFKSVELLSAISRLLTSEGHDAGGEKSGKG